MLSAAVTHAELLHLGLRKLVSEATRSYIDLHGRKEPCSDSQRKSQVSYAILLQASSQSMYCSLTKTEINSAEEESVEQESIMYDQE